MLHEDLIVLTNLSTWAHEIMIQLGILCKCYILIVYVQSICLTDMCWLTLYIDYYSVSLLTELANAGM